MKKILIIGLLLLGISLPTFAQNWIELGNKLYVDIDSIEQYIDDNGNIQKNQYTLWQKRLNDNSDLFKDIEKIYNKKVHYTLCKDILDVKTKKITPKAIIVYGMNGNVIKSFEFKDILMEWRSIVPDTVGEVEFEIVREYINR